MKTQILFVDDEANILEGLQRMLRPMRDEWDTKFALSGAQALEFMETSPIDILITDMRMPEMSGADLLNEVIKRHPGVIRMVLSGYSDAELIMKSVGVAHQFISKPCEPDALKAVITRSVELRKLLKDNALKSTISEMDTLPSIPDRYLEMSEELRSPKSSLNKVGQIIARDPAMTAKILQLANSAFFGRRRRASDITEAVAYLGLDCIQHLFLAAHVFAQFTVPRAMLFSINSLWEHSIATATLAKEIAKKEGMEKIVVEDSFTAGLLHDIGKLILVCLHSAKHAKAVEFARSNAKPLWFAEQQILSSTHAEVGAYLLGLWGLPDTVVEAAAYHHNPLDAPSKEFCALTALHMADCQVANVCYAGIPAPQPNKEYLSKFPNSTEPNSQLAS